MIVIQIILINYLFLSQYLDGLYRIITATPWLDLSFVNEHRIAVPDDQNHS